MAGLHKRGGTWHLRMRVPRRYLAVVGKGEIHRSLRTDSERRAKELLPLAEAKLLKELEAMAAISTDASDQMSAMAAATHLAAERGFIYRSVSELSEAPLDELLDRFASVAASGNDVSVAKAVLGGVEEPGLRLSQLAAEVERISAHENRFKNANQMRVWRTPKARAAANLKFALGGDDVLVSEIDNGAALRHKAWWQRKIDAEGLSIETANRDLSNMAGMLRRYYESIARPNPPEPYRRVSLRDRHKQENRKLEIPVEWIQERWFAPGAFDGINDEARDILLISIETGCRQSEIHDLPPGAIVLDHPIPHLEISLNAGEYRREVKNTASVRKVPLVGVALAAAKRHPDGFPRYRGKASYSANMNSRLRGRGLLPSSEHTIGGVRHSWESRMDEIRISETEKGHMMGHSIKKIRGRPVYGDDISLERKAHLARKLALKAPGHLL